jgi:beta-lactamase class A
MQRLLPGWVLGSLLVPVGLALADAPPAPSAAEAFLASIQPSPELQASLDAILEELRRGDARLRQQTIRVSLIDLPPGHTRESGGRRPRIAHRNGDSPVYPASVPKFVYLMAAYAWRDEGRLEIDPAFERQLRAMIYKSSNRATQRVVSRLTGTEPGQRLDPEQYREFAYRRHAVKRWLEQLGIDDLHTIHPTYDGGGDLHGRDVQFLEDKEVAGALPEQQGPYFNRQAMTANASARLLALLAEDLALSPESSREVREHMRRDPRKQPYLRQRIAGGVDPKDETFEVFSKTGTWGPIFADAGIVRRKTDGHQLVVVVFLEAKPGGAAYRGPFIAKLTRAATRLVFTGAAARLDPPGSRGRHDGAPG